MLCLIIHETISHPLFPFKHAKGNKQAALFPALWRPFADLTYATELSVITCFSSVAHPIEKNWWFATFDAKQNFLTRCNVHLYRISATNYQLSSVILTSYTILNAFFATIAFCKQQGIAIPKKLHFHWSNCSRLSLCLFYELGENNAFKCIEALFDSVSKSIALIRSFTPLFRYVIAYES